MTVDLTQYDAETPITGSEPQYISPTWNKDPDEDHISETLAQLFVAAVIAAKLADWSGLAKRWSERGYDSQSFHQEVSAKFIQVLQQSAGAVLVRATGLGRQQAMMDFTAEMPAEDWKRISADWSQVYGHQMAKQIADQSEKAVASVVPLLINRGLRGDPLAVQVKMLYGLDPRSMTSAHAFLTSDKKPPNKTILDIATAFLARRAKVIGDVQSFTGLNFGRQLYYMEAVERGVLPKSARKVWVTAIDERVCPVCKPMDGVTVGLFDTFTLVTKSQGTIKLLVPPVHPNCRCTVVPEERYRHGIITRRARFSDEGPLHRARLVSAVEDLVSLGKSGTYPQEVEKFSEADHPRDQDGRFVPLEAARDRLLLNKPKGLIKPKAAKATLSRHQKGVDNRLRKLPTGTYVLPRSYLEAYARGWGVRLGQDRHTNRLAAKIKQEGFKKPITIYVFNDSVFIRDGAHRLEAAYRVGINRIPTRVVRIRQDYEPFHRGFGGWMNERRVENLRRRVKARGKYTKPIEVKERPWDPMFARFNRRMMATGDVSKFFNVNEARDHAGRWVAGHGGAANVAEDAILGGVVLGAGAATVMNPQFRKEALAAFKLAQHGTEVHEDEAAKYTAIFHGFSHGGFTSHAISAVRTTGGIQVRGSVRDANGEIAGIFIRHFKPGGVVDHSLFEMEPGSQGSGFGSAFIQHSFDEYRKMGMKAVTVHANIDVGGYTWASMGFKFDDPKRQTDLIERLAKVSMSGEKTGPFNDDEVYQLNRLAEDMRKGLYVTPQDIAKVGLDNTWEENGHKMWVGKKILLNSHWYGRFDL